MHVPSLRYYVLAIRTVRKSDIRKAWYVIGAHSAADALVVAETTICPTHIYDPKRVVGTVEHMQCLPEFPRQLSDVEKHELEKWGHARVKEFLGRTD